MIIDARREDGTVYPGILADAMCSTRDYEIINDFIEWGLLDIQIDAQGEEVFVAPDIWDTYIKSLKKTQYDASPDVGLESLGQLLGICSLVKHRDRRRHIGLKLYVPIKALAVKAIKQDERIKESDARAIFTRHSSWDADRRWLTLTYRDRQKVSSLRFFSDMTGDPWILNHDVSVALERVIGRTNELLRERGIIV